MKKIKCIVKRKGHQENYEEKKVYASVYSAALNCHYGERQAESIASKVTKKINAWSKQEMKKKRCIMSVQIRNKIISTLKKFDKDVELMYKHHLDFS